MATAWLPYAAGALSLYPLLSAYYLRHPLARFCHPPLPSLRVRTSAHRGGAAERPENSMAAFEHCVNHARTDLIELDVHLTADGQVVVYHDQTVNRLAEDGVVGQVSDFTYATLPPLRRRDVPLPPPFHAPGALLDWHPAEPAPSSSSASSPASAEAELRGATVPPLLEHVFERFPSQCINIDLKHGNAELVDKVAALVHKHRRHHITIWGSGQDVVAQQMYARDPNIPLFTSARQIGLIFLKYITGWLPFSPIKERAIEMPLFTPTLRQRMQQHGRMSDPSAPGIRAWLSRTAVSLFSWASTSPPLLRHLQSRNIKVIFWVTNEEGEFAEALALHAADGVMTDYPSRLAEFVRNMDERTSASASSSASSSAAAQDHHKEE